jgi:hypothetical protein
MTHPLGIQDIIGDKREAILRLAHHYGMTNVRVFGSVARGEARPDSDVDLLVDYVRVPTLITLIAFEQDVEDLLGRSVDITIAKNLKSFVRPSVERDVVPL